MNSNADTNWKSVNTEYLRAVATLVHADLEIFLEKLEDVPNVEPLPLIVRGPKKTGFIAWLFGESGPSESEFSEKPSLAKGKKPENATDWSGIRIKAEETLKNLSDTRENSLQHVPSFARLGSLFKLSDFEENVMRLCLAAELKHSVDSLCARAHADARRAYPTLNLALQIFKANHEDYSALSPNGPLRYWTLIEVIQPSGTRLFDAALRIDDRVLAYCLQENSIDDRLLAFGRIVSTDTIPNANELSSAQRHVMECILQIWSTPSGVLPSITLTGPDAISKLAITVGAANHWGMEVFRIPAEHLPISPVETDQLARIWLRELFLHPRVLYLDVAEEGNGNYSKETDASSADRSHGSIASIKRFLNRVPNGNVIASPENEFQSRSITLDVARPSPSEQSKLWQSVLRLSDPQYPGRLATQFNLDESAIRSIGEQVQMQAAKMDEQQRFQIAWDKCRIRTRPHVEGLAQRIVSADHEVRLVLSDDARNQLDELKAQVSNRWQVYDSWGLRDRLSRGLGIAAMFVGESGTGKTSAATEIANDLDLDLFRIDLSGVINKYVGETEKNLRRVFNAFEDCGAVLFIDECDAIFGKRTDVKDSHDRYANIEVSYLLQRIESYHGLAILATNKAGAIDSAFLRRLRFIINFPLPTVAQRKEIWQRLLPVHGKPPTKNLNYDWLAAFDKLTGGTIHSASLHAAFLAAQHRRSAVVMEDVRDAIKAEYVKLNIPLRAAELQYPTQEI